MIKVEVEKLDDKWSVVKLDGQVLLNQVMDWEAQNVADAITAAYEEGKGEVRQEWAEDEAGASL